MTVDNLTVDKLTVDKLTVDELTVDELTVDKFAVDHLTVDELTVDKLRWYPEKASYVGLVDSDPSARLHRVDVELRDLGRRLLPVRTSG